MDRDFTADIRGYETSCELQYKRCIRLAKLHFIYTIIISWGPLMRLRRLFLTSPSSVPCGSSSLELCGVANSHSQPHQTYTRKHNLVAHSKCYVILYTYIAFLLAAVFCAIHVRLNNSIIIQFSQAIN